MNKVGISFAIVVCFLSWMNGALSQSAYPNVLIDIQANNYEYAPCEPSIAINPTDTNNIVAGAILDRVYVSNDGGKSWIESELNSKHGVYGDPCIIANNKGDFYYFHLANPGDKGWGSDRFLESIVVQRSCDRGESWSDGSAAGTNAPKDQDKEWAVSTSNSKRIYATWTQFDKYESKVPTDSSNVMFSSTTRKAKKWKKAIRINEFAGDCADDDGTVEGAVPAVGPDGEVYVAWAVNEKIYFDRSFDKGRTWMQHDIVAADIPKGWSQEIPGIMRCNGMPILVCDNSKGPNRGSLYICWADIRNGETNTDIWVVSSKDRGTTWTLPMKVNNDTSNKHQFFPWIAIDQVSGNLHVVFYDRRNYTDDQTDVFLATSTDGGITWNNERISEKPFTPEAHVFFGDYNNISAHNGIVRPIWTRYEDKKTSVWTALIKK
jgi:hypothetical protein